MITHLGHRSLEVAQLLLDQTRVKHEQVHWGSSGPDCRQRVLDGGVLRKKLGREVLLRDGGVVRREVVALTGTVERAGMSLTCV